ncbi:MAG: response regulator transcription factor [Pseudomonadota bacterium]
MQHSPTIYIVDDDDHVRESLSLLLKTEGFNTQDFETCDAFLENLDLDQHGCLLLDVRMPGIGGLELQDLMNERQIKLPIIFMTGHGNIPTSVRALKSGAVDFLEKPFDKEVLLQRIEEALGLDAKNRAADAGNAKILECYETLTPREKEVMAQVVLGQSNKRIARNLDISPRTVELHRTRMMAKMQVDSVAALVSYAMVCGIYDPAQLRIDQ